MTTTYKIPDPPESGSVWQWNPNTKDWTNWRQMLTAPRVWEPLNRPGWRSRRWAEVLELGEVFDKKPLTPQERVMEAAIVWRDVTQHATEPADVFNARVGLEEAVDQYLASKP